MKNSEHTKKEQVQHSVVDVVAIALGVELPKGGLEQAVLHGRGLSLLARKAIWESSNSWRFYPLPVVGENGLNPESGIHAR